MKSDNATVGEKLEQVSRRSAQKRTKLHKYVRINYVLSKMFKH